MHNEQHLTVYCCWLTSSSAVCNDEGHINSYKICRKMTPTPAFLALTVHSRACCCAKFHRDWCRGKKAARTKKTLKLVIFPIILLTTGNCPAPCTFSCFILSFLHNNNNNKFIYIKQIHQTKVNSFLFVCHQMGLFY